MTGHWHTFWHTRLSDCVRVYTRVWVTVLRPLAPYTVALACGGVAGSIPIVPTVPTPLARSEPVREGYGEDSYEISDPAGARYGSGFGSLGFADTEFATGPGAGARGEFSPASRLPAPLPFVLPLALPLALPVLASVPEPSSVLLLGTWVLLVLGLRKRL